MKKYILYSFLFLFSLININSYSQSCNQIYINMYDSSADGWNGNYLSIIDSAGSTVFTTTLDSSDSGIDSVCLFDDCYIISCGGGVNQTEVSWNLTDSNGIVLTSGGAPFSDSICFPIHVGCMDPYANNYDSSAVVDDGTCLFNCTPVTLNMYDSWGDGWNGNIWTLFDAESNEIFSYTLDTGTDGLSEVFTIEETGCYPGDLNNDDILNILDVLALVNAILTDEFNDQIQSCGDMNEDGTINILDILAIVNIILS